MLKVLHDAVIIFAEGKKLFSLHPYKILIEVEFEWMKKLKRYL